MIGNGRAQSSPRRRQEDEMGKIEGIYCHRCGKEPRRKGGRYCARCAAEIAVDKEARRQTSKGAKEFHKICKGCGTPYIGFAQSVNCRECRVKIRMAAMEKKRNHHAAEQGIQIWSSLPGTMGEIVRLNKEAQALGMSYGPYVAVRGL